ncbi:MAG: hypothetical protein WA604_10495, partial [Candidatus Sulfotelmatobacter sp.]
KWSANLGASGSFTLPNLWQQYAPDDGDDGLVYDRNALYDATLTYTDDARLRVSLEGASQRVAGFTNGMVTSTGVSVAWQVAPAISLRAWTMHVDDTTAASPPYIPFYASGNPATVNAFWLTYDNGGALRVDRAVCGRVDRGRVRRRERHSGHGDAVGLSDSRYGAR